MLVQRIGRVKGATCSGKTKKRKKDLKVSSATRGLEWIRMKHIRNGSNTIAQEECG